MVLRGGIFVLELNRQFHVLTGRTPRDPHAHSKRQRVVLNGDLLHSKSVPATPKDVQLSTNGLGCIGQYGEIDTWGNRIHAPSLPEKLL